MKKIFCFLPALIMALNLFAQQPGHLKITLQSVQCNRETWDDIVQLDGKGDEVFFNFASVWTNGNGQQKAPVFTKRTNTYGDNTAPAFSNRIKAGSAVDLLGGNKGGIKGGDLFNCNEMIGEFDIEADDVVTVMPTVWEWDPGTDILSDFSNSINRVTALMGSKAAEFARAVRPVFGSLSDIVINVSKIQVPNFIDVVSSVVGKQGDRPIGMTMNGGFDPKAIILKSAYLQTAVNSDFGYGKGVIAVNYDELSLGNTRDHGNYTLLIKVEFTPKPGSTVTATTTAPPATTTTTTPPPPKTTTTMPNTGGKATIGKLLPASTIVPASPIAGDWTGTYGDGGNDGPIFYSFRFNNGGVMSTLEKNGNVQNTGTYSFANNQVSGHYDQYSFAGTLDGSGTFTGTWGSGSSTSGLGKWKMRKK